MSTSNKKKAKAIQAQTQKNHPSVPMLMMQLRGMEGKLRRMEEMLTKNTQIFQESLSLMDIRQGLVVRKLRMSVVGFDWEIIFGEYMAAAAILTWVGHYSEHFAKIDAQRAEAKRAGAPEQAVVFGGAA